LGKIKGLDENFVLINENSPTYVSKLKASTALGFTIKKEVELLISVNHIKIYYFILFPYSN
jgi:hypothetical protein